VGSANPQGRSGPSRSYVATISLAASAIRARVARICPIVRVVGISAVLICLVLEPGLAIWAKQNSSAGLPCSQQPVRYRLALKVAIGLALTNGRRLHLVVHDPGELVTGEVAPARLEVEVAQDRPLEPRDKGVLQLPLHNHRRARERRTVGYAELSAALTAWRADHEWLRVGSSEAQQTLRQLCATYGWA
jgi:hypothetical protein